MAQEPSTENEFRWYHIAVGFPLFVLMVYAGLVGFIARGLYYGFMTGMDTFDEFFETEAAKKKAQ